MQSTKYKIQNFSLKRLLHELPSQPTEAHNNDNDDQLLCFIKMISDQIEKFSLQIAFRQQGTRLR